MISIVIASASVAIARYLIIHAGAIIPVLCNAVRAATQNKFFEDLCRFVADPDEANNGGEISANSEVGAGTTFIVKLPSVTYENAYSSTYHAISFSENSINDSDKYSELHQPS